MRQMNQIDDETKDLIDSINLRNRLVSEEESARAAGFNTGNALQNISLYEIGIISLYCHVVNIPFERPKNREEKDAMIDKIIREFAPQNTRK